MSSTPARARIGCIASVTGEFQPSITTSTFSAIISLARLTPTAGVLSSSFETSAILRPEQTAASLICSTGELDGVGDGLAVRPCAAAQAERWCRP